MARSSRRAKPWQFGLPAALAALVLAAFVISTLMVLNKVYHDELKHMDGPEQRLQERLRNAFLRRAAASPDSDSADLNIGREKETSLQLPNRPADETDKVDGKSVNALADEHPHEATEAADDIINERPEAENAGPEPKVLAVPENVEEKADKTKQPTASPNKVVWKKHEHRSCQNYVGDDAHSRSLEDTKAKCLENDACVAIECGHGGDGDCTMRAIANLVSYEPADCYERLEMNAQGNIISTRVHPEYQNLLGEYPFQQVTTQFGNQVNIILVRSQMSHHQKALYEKYKNDILFLGISSMNDYPLGDDGDWVNMFPGFLHMMHDPEKHFPPHVKTLLMSQSDFNLPDYPEHDYSVPRKYDFTYSASDCDVASDGAGWCGWSKNWSFVRDVLPIMCDEYKLKGVLVATKDKSDTMAYKIPKSCKGLMKQTTYLPHQEDYFNYLRQSRFAFLPQIHDASPRVSTQALALDVPILMNYHIQGGWKYVNEKTGEFFHDVSDFRKSLDKILKGADTPNAYTPRKWVLENYGNEQSGKKLLAFVKEHFSDRVALPKGTKLLLI